MFIEQNYREMDILQFSWVFGIGRVINVLFRNVQLSLPHIHTDYLSMRHLYYYLSSAP